MRYRLRSAAERRPTARHVQYTQYQGRTSLPNVSRSDMFSSTPRSTFSMEDLLGLQLSEDDVALLTDGATRDDNERVVQIKETLLINASGRYCLTTFTSSVEESSGPFHSGADLLLRVSEAVPAPMGRLHLLQLQCQGILRLLWEGFTGRLTAWSIRKANVQ